MKKLILALLAVTLLGRCILWGQEISVRIDASNAFFGSDVNPPALNWKVGISDYYNGTSTMLGMEIEQFNAIDYWQWTFIKFDQDFRLSDKISILPGIAFSQIYHKTTYSNNALTYAFNFEVKYRLNEYLKISIQANRERAADIMQIWRDSAYFGLIYYWNE